METKVVKLKPACESLWCFIHLKQKCCLCCCCWIVLFKISILLGGVLKVIHGHEFLAFVLRSVQKLETVVFPPAVVSHPGQRKSACMLLIKFSGTQISKCFLHNYSNKFICTSSSRAERPCECWCWQCRMWSRRIYSATVSQFTSKHR